MSFIVQHRIFVNPATIADVLPSLERTEDRVWLCKSESCRRYTIRGVPARIVDVCVTEVSESDRLRTVVEIGEKTGRYDAAKRWTVNIRRWSSHSTQWEDSEHILHSIIEGTFTIALATGKAIVLAEWSDGNWAKAFPALRSVTRDTYDLPAVVMWHRERYYQHVPYEEARTLADSFPVLFEAEYAGRGTLSEANRLASRELYRLARNLGWRKLTLREQRSYGVTGQWHREELLVKVGQPHTSQGIGEYTTNAANGRVPLHEDERNGYIQTSYGPAVVE